MKLLSILFLILIFCILTNSGLSLAYASLGLELWFQKMIPTLLPFMILSGIMVRLKLTEKISMAAWPVIRPLFKVRKNVCYAMLMGFLCGFPMGARVVEDLYSRGMITRREAEYLLSFCNNIGPVYFCGFVLPLLGRRLVLPYVFGMYGIPLLYGLALRYTLFRGLDQETKLPLSAKKELVCCEFHMVRSSIKMRSFIKPSFTEQFLEAVNSSIHSAVQSILMLGGYMILFNLLNLLPHLLLGGPPMLIAPLLEITGGLKLLQDKLPLYSLLALSFGGASCIAQTYSCIAGSDLSIAHYVFHKAALTLLNALFYLGWFLLTKSLILSPESFLR